MILPFMSFAWSPYAGKFGMPMVRTMCDVPNAARHSAPHLVSRIKGRRTMLFQNAENGGNLFHNAADRLQGRYRGLWFTAGIAATKAAFTVVVEQLYANKGDLDFAVFDIESTTSAFVLSAADLNAIYADPRYAALVASGRFPADCRSMNQSEIMHFNYGCHYICNEAIVQALITPLYRRYNNLNWSQFADSPLNKADSTYAVDLNGNAGYYPASTAPVYSPVLYGYVDQLGTRDARFKQPFYMLAWQSNLLRATYRAKADARLMPWVAPRVNSNVLDNTTWQENIFHTCCLAGANLLYFNGDDHSALSNWRFDNAVSQFVGQSRGKNFKSPLTTDMLRYDTANWIHSACRLADNSVVGRVTFKPGVNTATFTVAGRSYTVKRPSGGVGAWFHS